MTDDEFDDLIRRAVAPLRLTDEDMERIDAESDPNPPPLPPEKAEKLLADLRALMAREKAAEQEGVA